MNLFLVAADALLVLLICSLPAILMGSAIRRVVASGVVTLFASIALMMLSIAFGRPDFADLSLALALLAIGGSLSYAYMFERWL